MGIKEGQEIDIRVDKRYIEHVRDLAVTDVYDALVELITNADDSYNRQFIRNDRQSDGQGP